MSLSVKRILIDLLDLSNDPLPDVLIHIDEDNIQEVVIGIVGTKGTPYDGGVFPFHVRFTNRYPAEPPKVTFLTPNNKIRFHPNLYESGKVCLSILGTWSGPEWTSVMNLRSLILSLQSILSENPLRNEPGYETESIHGRRNKIFNDFIRYVTAKYAIADTIRNPCRVRVLEKSILQYVSDNIERYASLLSGIPTFAKEIGDDGYLLRTMYGMHINIDSTRLVRELTEALGRSEINFCPQDTSSSLR